MGTAEGTDKTALVADFLHGIIGLTKVEQFIVATPVFNRLHGVKQNSTAYLTYPSLNHSRFAHSLGAMHLSSQMYSSALFNASEEDRSKFLNAISDVIKQVNLLGRGIPTTNAQLGSLDGSDIQALLSDAARGTYLLTKNVPIDLDADQQLAYCIGMQALRIAALIHDLGHPPFSHVTEYAVKSLCKEISVTEGAFDHCIALQKLEKDGVERHKEPHETLTLTLFDSIRDLAVQVGVNMPFASNESYIFACVCLNIASAILNKGKFIDNNIDKHISPTSRLALVCLQSLEDGSLDADRLDYVQRDVLMSGIRGDGFRPERLISLLKLVYDTASHSDIDTLLKSQINITADNSLPRILPGVRALRSLEEFYEWRSELYRTVLYHHHVIRTDGLFQDMIKKIALEVISEKPSQPTKDTILSPDQEDVHWLWTIYLEAHNGPEVQMNLYLQWDDHWLMSVLRKKYLSLKNKVNASHVSLTMGETITLKRLEEIVASRKNYISLIKRYEDYRNISDGFATELLTPNTSGAVHECQSSTENSSQPSSCRIVAEILNEIRTSHDQDIDPHCFVRTIQSAAFKLYEFYPERIDSFKKETISDAIESYRTQKDYLEVFHVNKPPKPAVELDAKIVTDSGDIELFSKYSSAPNELNERGRYAPEHFIYVLPKAPPVSFDRVAERKEIGRQLARHLISKIEQSNQGG